MKTKKKLTTNCINVTSLITAIVLIVVSYFFKDEWLGNLFLGLGCSILAASMVAIIYDHIEMNRKKEERYNQLSALRYEAFSLDGRILWFEERINEGNYCWDLAKDDYFGGKFWQYADMKKFDFSRRITYRAAREQLLELSKKYNSGIVGSKDIEYVKIIILQLSEKLIDRTTEILNERISLDSRGIISLSEIEAISCEVTKIYVGLANKGGNYGKVIEAATKLSDILFDMTKEDGTVGIQPLEETFRFIG